MIHETPTSKNLPLIAPWLADRWPRVPAVAAAPRAPLARRYRRRRATGRQASVLVAARQSTCEPGGALGDETERRAKANKRERPNDERCLKALVHNGGVRKNMLGNGRMSHTWPHPHLESLAPPYLLLPPRISPRCLLSRTHMICCSSATRAAPMSARRRCPPPPAAPV